VVGLDYKVKGRPDRMNSQKDTLRALEFMGQHLGHNMSAAEAKRWHAHARTLDDRSYKMDPDSVGEPANAFPVSPSQQADARENEGRMKHFWGKCKDDFRTQKGKPTTTIQAKNFAVVKQSGEA